MSDAAAAAKKLKVIKAFLEEGMVLVALDARRAGVDVPEHLRNDPQLRLNLSYRFGLPMTVNGWGVTATLTFSHKPYACRIPWPAVFLIVSHIKGQPHLFPEDIPGELLVRMDGDDTAGEDQDFPLGASADGAAAAAATSGHSGPHGRPQLTLIKGGDDAPHEASDGATPHGDNAVSADADTTQAELSGQGDGTTEQSDTDADASATASATEEQADGHAEPAHQDTSGSDNETTNAATDPTANTATPEPAPAAATPQPATAPAASAASPALGGRGATPTRRPNASQKRRPRPSHLRLVK